MAKRKTKPLRCAICNKFIGYNEKIHYFQPSGGSWNKVELPEQELEHWNCYEDQKRSLERAAE